MKAVNRTMRKMTAAVEWMLLILLVLYLAPMVIPFSDMHHFSRDINQAKKEGSFYPGSPDRQTYYDNKLRIDGIIYREGQLSVYMTGTGLGPYSKLPSNLQIETDSGMPLQYSGGGSSHNVLRTKGYYVYKNVPDQIRSVTIRNPEPAYGQSIAFHLSLEGSGRHGE